MSRTFAIDVLEGRKRLFGQQPVNLIQSVPCGRAVPGSPCFTMGGGDPDGIAVGFVLELDRPSRFGQQFLRRGRAGQIA